MKYSTAADIRSASKPRELCTFGNEPPLTVTQLDAIMGNVSSYALERASKGDWNEFVGSLNRVDGIEEKPPLVTIYGFTEGETVYARGYERSGLFSGPLTITKEQHGENEYRTVCAVSANGAIGGFSADRLSYDPPKPKFLPIERPVRVKDLEPGDVLRYCGHEHHGDNHSLNIGDEVTVTFDGGRGGDCFRVVEDSYRGEWGGEGFSFVRRPGFAKVRDGYVKNGDTVWWLGDTGPEMGVVGDIAWESHNRWNIEKYPQCYQKAEPKKTDAYDYLVRGISALSTAEGAL